MHLQKNVFLSLTKGNESDTVQVMIYENPSIVTSQDTSRKHLLPLSAMGFPFDIVTVGKCCACKYMYKVAVILNILSVSCLHVVPLCI